MVPAQRSSKKCLLIYERRVPDGTASRRKDYSGFLMVKSTTKDMTWGHVRSKGVLIGIIIGNCDLSTCKDLESRGCRRINRSVLVWPKDMQVHAINKGEGVL